MKTIIHISADFPDPLVPGKTKAVANLLAACPGFRHMVYSLNRVSWHKGVALRPFGEDHTAIAYGAPPYGVALDRFLKPVTTAITHDLRRRGIKPGLIHAHKFSVEGLVAADIAQSLGCPFVCSLWGDTDIKIFDFKRRLRPRYLAVARQAELLLPAAPWTGHYFRDALQLPMSKLALLPVITAGDVVIPPTHTATPRLVSVFALDSWKRKGLDVLADAAMLAAHDIPDLTIDIYGTGSDKSVDQASRVLGRSRAGNVVRLMGALPHDQVQRIMNGYAAYVMAPRRETYGMVHVEAVLAGLPILWSKDRGVDGLFDEQAVGYRADPTSAEDVATGIRHLVAHEESLKQSIGRSQTEGAFEHLRSPAIAAHYSTLLAQVAA